MKKGNESTLSNKGGVATSGKNKSQVKIYDFQHAIEKKASDRAVKAIMQKASELNW